jgi:aryl-alcohol dehydrogenase-like predicted oxidoreductase
MAFLPYFPLASGLLTGKYRKDRETPKNTRITDMEYFKRALTAERLERVEALARYAESRGRRLLDLAVSWLLRRPVVASVIAGATSPDQVKRNALAATWKLTKADLVEVDSLAPA